MKENDLENALRNHLRETADPTPGWRGEILAAANAEGRVISTATPAAGKWRKGPPRWLLGTWAAAWALIIILQALIPGVHHGENSLAKTPVQPSAAPQPRAFLALNRNILNQSEFLQ